MCLELVDREILDVRVQGDIADEFRLLHRLEVRKGKLFWVPEAQVCAEAFEDGTDRPFWVSESAWCLRERGFTKTSYALPKETLQIDLHEPLPPSLMACSLASPSATKTLQSVVS